jgi:hypothetical protein
MNPSENKNMGRKTKLSHKLKNFTQAKYKKEVQVFRDF